MKKTRYYSKAVLVIVFIAFFIYIGITMYTHKASENISEDIAQQELSYELKNGNIDLNWNIINDSEDYYFTILQDGIELEASWISGTHISIPDIFEDGVITFRIAAPGTSGLSIDYIKKYNRQVLLFNPFGKTSKGEIAFSWDADSLANLYHLEITTIDGKIVKQLSIYEKTFAIVENLEAGKYKWAVTPETKDGLLGIPSDWAYFEIIGQDLKVENVLGIEKNEMLPMLSTPLTYPETATIGPDGALYVSDTHSNAIWRCENGMSEIYIGTLVAGRSDCEFRRKYKINQPTDILFDKEGNMLFNDSGNKRICKVEKNTGIVSSIWNHGKDVKNFYIESDGSLTILSQSISGSGKVINNKTGEIDFGGYHFRSPIALIRDENKTIILDGGSEIELVLFINNKFKKSIPGVAYASVLWMDEEKNIYVGEHTTISKLNWELEKEKLNGNYANVVYITQGPEDTLLVTDSDAGGYIV